MSENRTSAWLRETLLDEIELLRSGKSDHNRAKSIAMLSREVLKSVEVEMQFRDQQAALKNGADLGALPLCNTAPRLPAPKEIVVEQQHTEQRAQEPDKTGIKDDLELTEVGGFKVGDRVVCANGKFGTVKKVSASGRIDVSEDTGGTFPYQARHLEPVQEKPAPIRSPIVPSGARFVPGRAMSGSRGG
jgi:hypothetical protein